MSVLVEPDDGAGVGVYVEDCDQDMNVDEDNDDDGAHDELWVYGNSRRQQMVPIPTAMPPMRMAA